MHEARIGGKAEDIHSFVEGERPVDGTIGEDIGATADDHADFYRMLAGFADQAFLNAADTVTHAPGLGIHQDVHGGLKGAHLHVVADALIDGDNAVEWRLNAEGLAGSLLKVVFDL